MSSSVLWRMPKRWLNRLIFYVGSFGLLFQLLAAVHAWWHELSLPFFWLFLLAPLVCILSGVYVPLQLQPELPVAQRKTEKKT